MIVKTAANSDGEVLDTEVIYSPEVGFAPDTHLWEEGNTVISGRLSYWIGSPESTRVAVPGEEIVFPAREPHRHWNAEREAFHAAVQHRPARNHAIGIHASAGLVKVGRTNAAGLPRNVFEAVLVAQLAETYPAGLPPPVAQQFLRIVAWVARRFGYEPHLPRYRHAERLLVPM